MTLDFLIPALQANGRSQSVMAWLADVEKRGENTTRARRYVDGDQDNPLSSIQKNLLGITSSNEDSAHFNDNQCSIILDTMLDRKKLLGVKSGDETTDKWINGLLRRNRIDALQVNQSENTLRDGNAYLHIWPNMDASSLDFRKAMFTAELAYDGNYGTEVMYSTDASQTPMLALKIWRITTEKLADTVRANVYYPDRIERWIGATGSALRPFTESGDGAVDTFTLPNGANTARPVIPWVDRQGKPLGVPFVHFRNRNSGVSNYGLSELENALPLQDASNRVLISTVATALLNGFPIRAAIGFEMPAAIVPGMMVNLRPQFANGATAGTIPADVLELMKAARLDQYEVADLSQLLNVANWLKQEMYAVTNTPADDVAANASGEARKQNEIKLIGKVNRSNTRDGNAWEDVIRMAAKIEAFYAGGDVPELGELSAEWANPEIRNDQAYKDSLRADYQQGLIDQRTYLEKVKDIDGYTDGQIDEIIAATEQAKNAAPNQINANDAQAVMAKLQSTTPPADGAIAVNASASGNGAAVNGAQSAA